MQCMKFKYHSNKNPSQNFNKNSKVLKNLKQFQKPQKLGQRSWKCMIKMKKVSYQVRNKDLETKKEVRKMKSLSFWVTERRREVCLSREIGENWERNCDNSVYRKIINLDRSRAIEKLSIRMCALKSYCMILCMTLCMT